MDYNVDMINGWLDELLDGAIQETQSKISNEHIWELGYEGEGGEPNPHTQNIVNLQRYKELLQAIKKDARI